MTHNQATLDKLDQMRPQISDPVKKCGATRSRRDHPGEQSGLVTGNSPRRRRCQATHETFSGRPDDEFTEYQ